MKHGNAIAGIVCVACLTACSMEQGQLADPGEIEGRISQFYDDIAAYDFEAMRAAYAPGVVILDGGQWLDGDGFEALVAGLESREMTWDFSFSKFETKVGSDTAHTSYEFTSPPDFHWYGAAHYTRSGGEWLMDLMVMMGVEEETDGQAAADDGSQYELSQIAGDLYRFRNGGHYSVVLVTPEGILLTDPVSEYDDEPALWLKEQLAQRFGVPVRYVVYSHHHLDHAAGGDVFADTAEFVAHENTLAKFEPRTPDEPLGPFGATMDRDGDNRISPEESDPGPLVSRFESWDANADGFLDSEEVASSMVRRVRPPDTVYSDRLTIELGGKTVELVHPGNNHSDDMTVVYFPEERVVYGVDFLGAFSGIPGGGFSASAMTDWIDSYKAVEALDFDIVAPGHGPMGRKADVTLTRMAWEDLHDAVAMGIAEGKGVEELQASITLDDYMHHPTYEERIQGSIAEAYRAITAHE